MIDSLIQAIREAETDDNRHIAETALAEVIASLEHTYIGPTWARDESGWILPERTLGWQIAGWCSTYLLADGATREDPAGWDFTDEQLRFLLWWYAIDENGKFLFRKGVLQRLKGWGKDPLLAVICLVEFVGPCRFAGWDDVGEPILTNEPNALVQIAATSQDQTRNTSDMFTRLASSALMSTYQITEFSTSSEIIRANQGRQQIQLVTSSYRSLEGKRSTFVCLNETHHWIEGNQGHKMYETIDGNVTKLGGRGARYLAITNAYLPGEDSVAERMRLSFQRIAEGKAVDVGVLYDTVEAHPLVPMHVVALRQVIPIIRGDAVWLDPDSILASIQDESIPVSRSRRMWLNQVVAIEDALYQESDWDTLEVNEYLLPGDEITLGFDGGRTDDSTALVAVRASDMLAVPLGIWEKDFDGWVVNKDAVNSKVAEAFKTYNVLGFYADVALWEEAVAEWHTTYNEGLSVRAVESGNAIAWDMRRVGVVAKAHERLVASVMNGTLCWTRLTNSTLSMTLRRHVLNAFREEKPQGLLFRKQSRESNRKVDAYAALMLAHEALNDYRIKGKKPDTRTNRVWFIR